MGESQNENLRDVLKEVANIKQAQLKVRPGRRAWEESPDFFKYTGFPDADTKRIRKESLDIKLEHAVKLKDQGNELFKQDVTEALSLYVKAVSVFVWFDRVRESEDVPLVNSLLDMKLCKDIPEDRLLEAREIISACFSNAALCLLKASKYTDAIYACSKALELEAWNVRALYRRAEAHYQLGTTANLELCVADLQDALKLEPGNVQVRKALNLRQAELREQDRKDRATFSGMFHTGALYKEGEECCNAVETSPRQDPHAPEVHAAMRDIQKGMASAKAKKMAAGGSNQQNLLVRGRGLPQQQGIASFFTTLSHVPWWGWVVILLHLMYRLYKLFKIPMAKSLQGDLHGNFGDTNTPWHSTSLYENDREL
ncbi:hypothetical protein CEUSTIGMA_g11770.t1 [Chlamydomonas eustigma]|uniref:Uncharacterized protein n=1 Tax=Chlamydomonas eustigma TaxID=1157962 RepID=A0A250XMP6_9CHLO|nr:hypothetical protein CEUSTIGMA_g11770.t1 [Chlamydomonas eustigma]|eukprot:GAX84348.1 hypothetical protein CEUSTIGMA_g11770.t1 [Chlamydomonas eustigma]